VVTAAAAVQQASVRKRWPACEAALQQAAVKVKSKKPATLAGAGFLNSA